jgi:hypothetical protein
VVMAAPDPLWRHGQPAFRQVRRRPEATRDLRHEGFDEPNRRLLRQRRDRNAVRFVEGRAAARNALCDTPSGQALRQAQERGSIGFCFTITGGCTRRRDISARWPSRKNGLPIKKGSPHHRSAKRDPTRRQVQCGVNVSFEKWRPVSGLPENPPVASAP